MPPQYLGLYRDNVKGNGNYYITIGYILGLYLGCGCIGVLLFLEAACIVSCQHDGFIFEVPTTIWAPSI